MDTGEHIDELTALTVVRARAEATEVEALLAESDRQTALIETRDWSSLRQMVVKHGVVLDLAQRTGRSEGQVVHLLAIARRARVRTPNVWAAFRSGVLDRARVHEIATAAGALDRHESWERLDATVVGYARTHTVAELRSWLKRFVARVEADTSTERAHAAREARRVDITHTDDSMAWINALVPGNVAAAVERRLTMASRAIDDHRTIDQRRADLLASWATSNADTSGEAVPGPDTHIAVVIDADTLVGRQAGMAISTDGSWTVPADWILETALVTSPVWQRLLVDPLTKNALAIESVGRFAPAALAEAIALRDGVCRAPGCLVAAHDCDKDHRVAYPEGATDSRNLWSLCRRHHAMKGHDILQWRLPTGSLATAELWEHGPPPDVCHSRIVSHHRPGVEIYYLPAAA